LSDVAVSHTIFILVTVILASAVSATVIFKTYQIMSAYSQRSSAEARSLETQLTPVYAYYNASDSSYYVFIRNSGYVTLTQAELSYVEVFLGPANGTLNMYIYSQSGGRGTWGLVTIYGSQGGQLSPGAMAEIVVRTGANFGNTVHIIISLPDGQEFSAYLQQSP
jgi:flagellar protein FlaG